MYENSSGYRPSDYNSLDFVGIQRNLVVIQLPPNLTASDVVPVLSEGNLCQSMVFVAYTIVIL